MTDVLELAALVSRARGGDLEAFDALVRRFQDMAVGYAYSILGEWGPAQDAAQEAFIQLYHDLPGLRAPEAFLSWFRRIVFKHCDRWRRARRFDQVPLETAALAAASFGLPAHEAEARETAGEVRSALAMLPETERSTIVLFYYQDASLKDISSFLGVSPSVVDHRLRAARQHLSERLFSMTQHDLQSNRPSNDPQFVLRVMDALTRLANAEGLDARLREEIQLAAAGQPGFGLALFNIDEFKAFNGQRGHTAGDALLAWLARQVQGPLQAGDYVARSAGEEFGLVLRRGSAPAVLQAADAIRATVAAADLSLDRLLKPEARYPDGAPQLAGGAPQLAGGAPQLPPSPANASFQRGLKRLQAGQVSKAAEAFRAALEGDANHAPTIMELAYLDFRKAASAAQLAETFHVTLSGGVSVYQAGDTAETLIARANAGLAQAKAAGRNQVQIGA